MIERIEMPEGSLGFRISGDLEREDYTGVMVPALHEELDKGKGLRTLYVLDTLDRMEPSALWEDAKTGFDLGVRRHSEWERTAIVTDQDWLANAGRLFAWMTPGELKVYPLDELEQAKEWVAGG